jgi:excisionase family DNA binding protein
MNYFKSSIGGAEMAEVANDNWINIDEAAEYLGVKPGTIRDWIRKDKGVPAHKVGKLWKFKRSELDAWIQSGKSAEN